MPKGANLYTDAHKGYTGLSHEYVHGVVDHAVTYVEGFIHTYISAEPFQLHRYLDEQSFRYNERKENDADRLALLATQVSGKRLPYKALMGKESVQPV